MTSTSIETRRSRWRLTPVSGIGRRVTWLELFFDLVFVAAVAQVGSRLVHDYTWHTLVPYAFLLSVVWLAWSGYALFATRFDSDDPVQRGMTLLQMVAVIFMAANAEEGLDSQSSAGFAAAYAAMRFLLAGQYLRASVLPATRALALEQALGVAVAASMWLVSALSPPPARYLLWAFALTTDVGTAFIGARHTETAPPHGAHLPERFGLFTLILFGESIVAVMKGIQSQPEWTVPAAAAAFGGIAIIFAFWWGYFEVASAAAERHVRCRDDARRFHVWSYTHVPFYLGLTLTTTGIEHVVRGGGPAHLGLEAAPILGGGGLLALGCVAALRATQDVSRRALECRRPSQEEP